MAYIDEMGHSINNCHCIIQYARHLGKIPVNFTSLKKNSYNKESLIQNTCLIKMRTLVHVAEDGDSSGMYGLRTRFGEEPIKSSQIYSR